MRMCRGVDASIATSVPCMAMAYGTALGSREAPWPLLMIKA